MPRDRGGHTAGYRARPVPLPRSRPRPAKATLASPILRDTIKKLRERQAQLQTEIKGPLEELRQIEQDLEALGAAGSSARTRRRGTPAQTSKAGRTTATGRAPRGANQAAILKAIRGGATTPKEISEKTSIPNATVNSTLTNYVNKQKLVTRGANGLTLTTAGREKLAELQAK
jgi:hypothetical protein